MVTSESVNTVDLENYLLANGTPAEMTKSLSALLMGFMNLKSAVVGPPQAPPEQPAASSQAAPVVTTTEMDIGDPESELTDVEVTDSDEETKIANDEGDPAKAVVKKKTKKLTKKEKKARTGAKAK